MEPRKAIAVCVAVNIFICVLLFVVGYFIGRDSVKKTTVTMNSESATLNWQNPYKLPQFANSICKLFDTDRMKNRLKNLTTYPHLAGSSRSKDVANTLYAFYKDLNVFDNVDKLEYTVLLSYPSKDSSDNYKTSHVTISRENAQLFRSAGIEESIGEEKGRIVPPFNGYSPNGVYKGQQIVYVNYARKNDFNKLIRETNDENIVKGKFVLARYGKIYRGSKVQNAFLNGASGIILYTDSEDEGAPKNVAPYPDTVYMPSTAIQRGTIIMRDGDPQTPFYPSIESAYRENPNTTVPKIPSIPITAEEAEKIFQLFTGGKTADDDWKGTLGNTTNAYYNFGAQLPVKHQVTLEVNTEMKTEKIYNIIATLKGTTEPDRYIIIGNHHDAWMYGGVDPNSGTMTIAEIAHSVAEKVKQGWKPRRTLIFGHWSGEEYALTGSTEFVEDYLEILNKRAVVYLNLDAPVMGNWTIKIQSSLGLRKVIYDATKSVQNPNASETELNSVYAKWLHAKRVRSKNSKLKEPREKPMGWGSDYVPFLFQAGVSSINPWYVHNPSEYKTSLYPLYHTRFDTYHLVANLMDPTMAYHKAVGCVVTQLAVQFLDSLMLPIDLKEYGEDLEQHLLTFMNKYQALIRKQNLDKQLQYLRSATEHFAKASKEFAQNLEKNKPKNELQLRMLNDQLMYLERAFLDRIGLPDDPLMKNVLMAPTNTDKYSGSMFPGLINLLDEKQINWLKFEKHMATITFIVKSATASMKNFDAFFSTA